MPLSSQELGSDEEVVCDAGRDSLEQSCEQAKEELTNSIRQQWRKLKHHVEKLDNQGDQKKIIIKKNWGGKNKTWFIYYFRNV